MSGPAAAADRNLLFGILAVQMDFIPRDGLVAAMNAWVLNKEKTLGEIMEEQQLLSAERHALLKALVNEHIKQHDNDPAKSLRAIASEAPTCDGLQHITDVDLQTSLSRLPEATVPPADQFVTRAPAPEAGASGHNNPEKSLRGLASETPTRDSLQHNTEVDLQAHLGRPPDATVPPADQFVTRVLAAAEAGASGQRFRILRPHARGGLGEVFVAEDLELHREVALKEIQAKYADDASCRSRFLLEAEVTGALEHPSIVPVYGLGQYADGRPFYAMRFIKGDSLKDAITRFHGSDWRHRDGQRTVAFRELLGRFVDVCHAIAYAHSRQVLHRDLKPGNIMLGKYGETLVVDWGLARPLDQPEKVQGLDERPLQPLSDSSSDRTIPGTALGTPQYMSPEQAAGRLDLMGPAADVYSLGATLYSVLTGRPPFTAADTGQVLRQVQKGDFPRPRQMSRRVPRPLEAVCLKAMALEPSRRYPTAHALAEDIERWLADEPVSAHRESWLKRGRRWSRRHQIVVTATVVLLLTGLSAAWLLVREHGRIAQAERQEARARVDALLHAKADAVPEALDALAPIRDLALPRLRQTRDDPRFSSAVHIRAALGLLPSDPSQVDFLFDHMLRESDPNEVLLLRDALLPYRQPLIPELWNVAEAGHSQAYRQRCLRALTALALYDPDNPRWGAVGERVVPAVLDDNPWHLGIWINALRPVRGRLIEPLVKTFRDSPDADDRAAAAQILAAYTADQPKLLVDFFLDADPKQFANLWPQIHEQAAQFIPLLEATLQPLPANAFDPASERQALRQAHAAVALLQLGREERVWPLLRHSSDPRVRSYLIYLFRPFGTDIQVLLARWPKETDISVRRALVLALGTYDVASIPSEQRQAFIKELDALYCATPDAGLHGAIDWLYRQRWAQTQVRELCADLAGRPHGSKGWLVNGRGQRFTIIPGPVEFDMGAPIQDPQRAADEAWHRVRIPRSFAVLMKEVPVLAFQRFLKAHPEVKYDFNTLLSPQLVDPAIQVSWFQAAMYCRWLSEQEGIPDDQMCFPPIDQIKDGMKLPADYLRRTGYRLPTEAEWEYACRAGAVTSRYYGNSVDLLPHYAWFAGNARLRRTRLIGGSVPNDLGLFDMLGNVREWCMDAYGRYPAAKLTEDVEGPLLIHEHDDRVLRGGGYSDEAAHVRCAVRVHARPTDRQPVNGFRLAQTMPAK